MSAVSLAPVICASPCTCGFFGVAKGNGVPLLSTENAASEFPEWRTQLRPVAGASFCRSMVGLRGSYRFEYQGYQEVGVLGEEMMPEVRGALVASLTRAFGSQQVSCFLPGVVDDEEGSKQRAGLGAEELGTARLARRLAIIAHRRG